MNGNWVITEIRWHDILPVWQDDLWPMRTSPCETHSAMTWPYTSESEYDMTIFEYPVTYWGFWDNNRLCGVNSGHATSDTEYRSRGLWVDPQWRSEGVGTALLKITAEHAESEGYVMCWSLPRVSALSVYVGAGFSEVGDIISTETSDHNQYVRRYL